MGKEGEIQEQTACSGCASLGLPSGVHVPHPDWGTCISVGTLTCSSLCAYPYSNCKANTQRASSLQRRLGSQPGREGKDIRILAADVCFRGVTLKLKFWGQKGRKEGEGGERHTHTGRRRVQGAGEGRTFSVAGLVASVFRGVME